MSSQEKRVDLSFHALILCAFLALLEVSSAIIFYLKLKSILVLMLGGLFTFLILSFLMIINSKPSISYPALFFISVFLSLYYLFQLFIGFSIAVSGYMHLYSFLTAVVLFIHWWHNFYLVD